MVVTAPDLCCVEDPLLHSELEGVFGRWMVTLISAETWAVLETDRAHDAI